MTICLKCGSDRVVMVDKGRKVKCLDCHKTTNRGSVKLPTTKDDNLAVMALLRRVTAGMYLSRDRIGDNKDFIESDVVKEGEKNGVGGNSKENK